MDLKGKIPEEYKDSISQEFAYDPIRLPIEQDPAQLLYNRKSLQKIWETKHQAINPFTRTPFDMNRAIPQTDLSTDMCRFIAHNNKRNLQVIPDYTKAISDAQMKDHLNALLMHFFCFPTQSPRNINMAEHWKVLWKKLNLLRLLCQYAPENKEIFLSIDGYRILFKVICPELIKLYDESKSQSPCEEAAKEVYREVARIVDIIGLTERDLLKIPAKSLSALLHVLYYLRKCRFVRIHSTVLRIFRQIIHDCTGFIFPNRRDCFGPHMVNTPVYLLGRRNPADVSNEDLDNGTAILRAVWAHNRFALVAASPKYARVLLDTVMLCISRYEEEGEHFDKNHASLALEQGLWLIHALVKPENDGYSFCKFNGAEKKLLSLDIVNDIVLRMARLAVAGLRFESSHMELALQVMIFLYREQGLGMRKREDVEVIEVLLRSDGVMKEYSPGVKDSAEEIVKYAGMTGAEVMELEGSTFRRSLGVYKLCIALEALRRSSHHSTDNPDD